MLVFGGRFLIEFYKTEQSFLLSSSLTMGQWLSIPIFLIGLFFYRASYRN
jgi:prolipoprotein diacylglyceryltransferase